MRAAAIATHNELSHGLDEAYAQVMDRSVQPLEFEVRLLRADGSLSILMRVSDKDLAGAKAQVQPMLKGDVVSATISFNGTLIGISYSDSYFKPA
jgi:hypothetical protein